MKGSRKLAVLVSACAAAFAARQAMAITVDGSLDSDYGSAIVSQTVNSGFGDSTSGDGSSAAGSELDAAYGTIQNGNLYIFLSGNIERGANNSSNHIDLFIDDGRAGGLNTLEATSTDGSLASMNGSMFSPGFNTTYALDVNDYSDTFYVDHYDLAANAGGYAGGIPMTGGIGYSSNLGQTTIGVGINNTNAAGVGGGTGAVSSSSIPDAVTTGVEFAIPLALLGNPTGPIKIMADINGNNNGYLSNQFLPGLPAGTGNLGGGGPYTATSNNGGIISNISGAFNFSNVPNEYFTVTPTVVPNGIWISSSGGNWSSSSNWSNGIVPNQVGAAANFSNSAGGSVTVDGPFTVGTLTFNTPVSTPYTLVPADTNNPQNYVVTMSNTSGDATITDFSGTHTIETNLYLSSNTDITIVNSNDSLFIGPQNTGGPGGDISGPGSLSSTNPGGYNSSTLYLLGTNTYTGGTIINSGTVVLDSPGAFPTDSALTMNASDVPDPTLDLAGNSITVSSLASITGPSTGTTGSMGLVIDSSSDVTVTYAGSNANPSTFFGRFINNSANGGGNISLVIASGSLTITGTSTSTSNSAPASYTGSTTIDSGATLTLAAATGGGALSRTSSITNNGTLNIDDFESIGPITNNGSVTIGIGGTFQIRPNMGTLTLASAGLTLSGGKIDVANNALVLSYGAPANDPIAAIRSAFAAGDVISSTAATVLGTSVGYADGNTDIGTAAAPGTILIRYTWLGDLNLDGQVTNSDYNTLQANLGNTNADWAHGDLNYDGVVNADDVSLFQLGVAEAGSNTLALPEPASIALLALPLLGLRRRRAV